MAGSIDDMVNGSVTENLQKKSSHHPQGWKVPQIAPWVGGLICCVCTHCTDEASLQTKLVEGGFLEKNEYSAADHRASQIVIWGNVIGILVFQRHPRCMGCIGGFLVLIASFIFATLDPDAANQQPVMIALGLMLLGGKFAFSSSLSFSNLLPARQGLLDGINGGMTDSSGLVFLPFINSQSISLHAWFKFAGCMAIGCIITALATFPDDAYDRSDQAEFSRPSLRTRQRRPSQARGSLSDQLRVFSGARLIGFMLSWAWCATALDWREGSKVSAYDGHAPAGFFKWGWTISSNMAILSAPTVGFLIDLTVPRWGYSLVGCLMLSSTAVMLVALLTSNDVLIWLSLIPNPFNVSLIWLTYYNYVQRCYPVEVMPCILVVSSCLEGLLGFLNSFAFATNPWGKDYGPLVVFFAAPLLLLTFWPFLERQRVEKVRVGGRDAEMELQDSIAETEQAP